MAKRCFALMVLAGIIFGQAAVAGVTAPNTAVSFPKEVIPVEAGKIEFWAKLSGVSEGIGVGGGDPYFFQIFDGSSTFQAGFNANDGTANGGLVGYAGSGFQTGTGLFGNWTYKKVFGTTQIDAWHQYVFQWNKDGIPGVADGQQKIALFVDGALNSGSWHGATPGTQGVFVPLTGGTLNFITTGSAVIPSAGEVAIDELKIYDGNDNLILWNTLGSAQEVAQSAVGLNGSFNGGGGAHFVPGISGNAIMAMPVSGLVGPASATVGGTATGLSPRWVRCLNLTTGQTLRAKADTASWDCGTLGLSVSPGDTVAMKISGLVGPASATVGGTATGLRLQWVRCLNLTTGQTLWAKVGTASWDCGVLGLAVSPGDTVAMKVRGIADQK